MDDLRAQDGRGRHLAPSFQDKRLGGIHTRTGGHGRRADDGEMTVAILTTETVSGWRLFLLLGSTAFTCRLRARARDAHFPVSKEPRRPPGNVTAAAHLRHGREQEEENQPGS